MKHEAAIEPAIVNAMEIPLAEVMVWPLAGWMVEVVRPRVEREFFDKLRVEPRLLQNLCVGVLEYRERAFDKFFVNARCDADIVNDALPNRAPNAAAMSGR